jgi:hypothetical protein
MQISKTVLLLNIVLCAILLGDAFVFPAKIKTVVLMRFSSKVTNAENTSYRNYFIHTSDKCKYEVSKSINDALKYNDTIKIFSSKLIGMPVGIQFKSDNEDTFRNIGQLPTKKSQVYLLIISIMLSIIVLLLELLNRSMNNYVYFPLYFITLGMTVLVLLFIIIELFMI